MSAKKQPEPFNNPFSKLAPPAKKAPKSKAPPPPARPAPPPRKGKTSEEEDAALFLESVGVVERVKQVTTRVAPPPPRTAAQLAMPSEEAESLARLAELVSGDEEFTVADDSAFVEGFVRGFDERVMKKLRAGEFSSQGKLDLHGLRSDAAKLATENFIQKARVAGNRCVLIVTGKGLHSEDQLPVLKSGLQGWLTRGRCARQVLAFCSARPKDGGAGAVYVLLRR
jgi:DNA-nicking Smr family endonuclease